MPKIGLEIHCYLNTKEKLFCRCRAEYGAKFTKGNTNICPICTAQPGSKPMLPNREAIERAIQICLILGCRINDKFVWQRKHYEWPDLPKGYQSTISGTYAIPVGEKGKFLGIGITEAHLEEDPASWDPRTGEVDYNKSGLPLMEIVTEPDFKSSIEVVEWLEQLTGTLKYMGIVSRNLGVKADVNISLPEVKGKRVEIKNLNSLSNIKTALEHEIQRQKKPGETPKEQETRMFDESKNTTIRMRFKEMAEDYRFISEPDLPAIKIERERIEKIRKAMPQNPGEKIKKLVKKYKVDKKHAEILAKNPDIAEFFEKIVEKTNPQLAVNWVMGELPRILNYGKKSLNDVDIKEDHFIELLNLIDEKSITELKAKEILNRFIPRSFSPLKEAKGHKVISSEGEIEKIAAKVIRENQKAVLDYKSGKKESLNFLIGQVMKMSDKRADFRAAKKILEEMLK
jgi:aspartyl-tRNA(Asn)/glutamyl-tRNA(Gln) amidotransferase subunit B